MTDMQKLQAMNYAERIAWLDDNLRPIRTIGAVLVKVDGHLATYAHPDDPDGLIARFLCYVARGGLNATNSNERQV